MVKSTVKAESVNTEAPVTTTEAVNTESESERKQPHLNVPANTEYLAAVKAWTDTHTLPIGKADGQLGRPSVAYALMHLTATALGYTLTDADRTSGRAEVSEAERAFMAGAKTLAKRLATLSAEDKAKLAALGIQF